VVSAQGIRFENSNWKALLAKAKAENKLLFVDAFTTWCGPCKQMAANVFPQKSVGDFYNRNFINAKIDMEAGEGLTIAERYHVNAYPTYLFINGDGKMVHKAIGYYESNEFITTGMNALNPSKQFYTLKENYKKGALNAEQLLTLVQLTKELQDEDGYLIINDYLKKQTNWLTDENIDLMLTVTESPESEYFKFLSNNEEKIKSPSLKQKIQNGLDRVMLNFLESTMKADGFSEYTTPNELQKMVLNLEKNIAPYRPARAKLISYYAGFILAEKIKDQPSIEKYMIAYTEEAKHELNWQELNEQAWYFFENIKTPASLRYALNWGLLSIALESNFYNNDTVANLYHKLGENRSAKIYAMRAIQLGKEKGEDVRATEELLKLL
jgi:thioredoxin-related protein